MRYPSMNVPGQSRMCRERDFKRVHNTSPGSLFSEDEWKAIESEALFTHAHKWNRPFVSATEVYALRNMMSGLVIGPIDKNLGESCVACPVLYHEALQGMFCEKTGYAEVIPKKCTAHMKKVHEEHISRYVISQERGNANQRGDETDIRIGWQHTYKRCGWRKYAPFDTKGGHNTVYGLFKMKNIIDPTVRQTKWMKMRPIAPSTRHPMRKLLHLAGRAWHFISKQVPGEHFVMNSTQEVPAFFREATQLLEHLPGDIKVVLRDIEGCYPNMPKRIITHSALYTTHRLQQQHHVEGVWVPRRGRQKPCVWRVTPRQEKLYHWFPFCDLTRILKFSLEHAVVRMPDRRLLVQNTGIPMGDALSPGATIMACAWMEHSYMEGISQRDRQYFKAGRYMDDLIVAYADTDEWDAAAFLQSVSDDCYVAPLTLEPSKPGVFLETEFEVIRGRIVHRLKNDNTDANNPKVWRNQHYNSYSPFMRKRAAIIAALRKTVAQASDDTQIIVASIRKLHEYRAAGYPDSVLSDVCRHMGRLHSTSVWGAVRTAALRRT